MFTWVSWVMCPGPIRSAADSLQPAAVRVKGGLKTIGNAQIRDLYESYVDQKILALGLDLSPTKG